MTNQKLTKVSQLRRLPLSACVADNLECLFIEADTVDGEGAEICLDPAEARALRDWLTSALQQVEPSEAQAGWKETSERCQLLLRTLNLIRNFHDCPPVIRALAAEAIDATPESRE